MQWPKIGFAQNIIKLPQSSTTTQVELIKSGYNLKDFSVMVKTINENDNKFNNSTQKCYFVNNCNNGFVKIPINQQMFDSSQKTFEIVLEILDDQNTIELDQADFKYGLFPEILPETKTCKIIVEITNFLPEIQFESDNYAGKCSAGQFSINVIRKFGSNRKETDVYDVEFQGKNYQVVFPPGETQSVLNLIYPADPNSMGSFDINLKDLHHNNKIIKSSLKINNDFGHQIIFCDPEKLQVKRSDKYFLVCLSRIGYKKQATTVYYSYLGQAGKVIFNKQESLKQVKIEMEQVPSDPSCQGSEVNVFKLQKVEGPFDPMIGTECEIHILNDIKNPLISFSESKLLAKQSQGYAVVELKREFWLHGTTGITISLSDIEVSSQNANNQNFAPYVIKNDDNSVSALHLLQNNIIDAEFQENDDTLKFPVYFNQVPFIYDPTFSELSCQENLSNSQLCSPSMSSIKSETSSTSNSENKAKLSIICKIMTITDQQTFPWPQKPLNDWMVLDILADVHHAIISFNFTDSPKIEILQSTGSVNILLFRSINTKGHTRVRTIISNYKSLKILYKDRDFYQSPIHDVRFENGSKNSCITLPLPDYPINVNNKFTDLEVEIADAADELEIDWEEGITDDEYWWVGVIFLGLVFCFEKVSSLDLQSKKTLPFLWPPKIEH